MFSLLPPSCDSSPIPVVCVCSPRRLHLLLKTTIQACGRGKSRENKERLRLLLCDTSEAQSSKGDSLEATEPLHVPEAQTSEAPDDCRSAIIDDSASSLLNVWSTSSSRASRIVSQAFGFTREPPADTTGVECVHVSRIFPSDTSGASKGERAVTRRRTLASGSQTTKGFLRRSWMQSVSSERTACVILCFDWMDLNGTVGGCTCCSDRLRKPDVLRTDIRNGEVVSPPVGESFTGAHQQYCSGEMCCKQCRCSVSSRTALESSEPTTLVADCADGPAKARHHGVMASNTSRSDCGHVTPVASHGTISMVNAAETGYAATVDKNCEVPQSTSFEEDATALIEFFRERMQRRAVVPKMIIFVILPAGTADPQSYVAFLRRLNPADIAAIFITCGIDDIETKLEKLEQVSYDSAVEFYESEARRYRKQAQATAKGDRIQNNRLHVFQTRCLIKAGYMLEFAQQQHAAMKSYIAAWQLLTSYTHMAPALERMAICNLISVRMYPMYFDAKEPAKAAHHAREHRIVLRENPLQYDLLGYLLPLWFAQLHHLLALLCEEMMHLDPNGMDVRNLWQFPGFHFHAAAQYLKKLRLWIREAKAQFQPPSMNGGISVPSEWLGQLDSLQHGASAFSSSSPDAAEAAAREEVILRFIFSFNEAQLLTSATHLLSKAHVLYKLIGRYRRCPALACELADAMFDGRRVLTARRLYATLASALTRHISSARAGAHVSYGAFGTNAPFAGSDAAPAIDGSAVEKSGDFDVPSVSALFVGPQGAARELASSIPAGGSKSPEDLSEGQSLGLNTGWWPLCRYVLLRLLLCVGSLLRVTLPSFVSCVGPNSLEGELLSGNAHRELDDDEPHGGSGAQVDEENLRLGFQASFDFLNVLALRGSTDDADGTKRRELGSFLNRLVSKASQGRHRNLLKQPILIELSSAVGWVSFNTTHNPPPDVSIFKFPVVNGSLNNTIFPSTPREALYVGILRVEHFLGFGLRISRNCLLLVNSERVKCMLRLRNNDLRAETENNSSPLLGDSIATSGDDLTLVHRLSTDFDVYVYGLPELQNKTAFVEGFILWWSNFPCVGFVLNTMVAGLQDKESSSTDASRTRTRIGTSLSTSPDSCRCQAGICWPPPFQSVLMCRKLAPAPYPVSDLCVASCPRPALRSSCGQRIQPERKAIQLKLRHPRLIWVGEQASVVLHLIIRDASDLNNRATRFKMLCAASTSSDKLDQEIAQTDHESLLEFTAFSGHANCLESSWANRADIERILVREQGVDVMINAGCVKRRRGSHSYSDADTSSGVASTRIDMNECDSAVDDRRINCGETGRTRHSDKTKARRYGVLALEEDTLCAMNTDAQYRSHVAHASNGGECAEEYTDQPPCTLDLFLHGEERVSGNLKALPVARSSRCDWSACKTVKDADELQSYYIPLLVRAYRIGEIKGQITVECESASDVEKCTVTFSVVCQIPLAISSRALSVAEVHEGLTFTVAEISLTNTSGIPMRIESLKKANSSTLSIQKFLDGNEPTGGDKDDIGALQKSDGAKPLLAGPLPMVLLPGEGWNGLLNYRTVWRPEDARIAVTFSRHDTELPFPFEVLGIERISNCTTVTVNPINSSAKPFNERSLQIEVQHCVNPAVGMHFPFKAVLTNCTNSLVEVQVSLSYSVSSPGESVDAKSNSNVEGSLLSCPFLVNGVQQEKIAILPNSNKTFEWILVPFRTGAFFMPTVRASIIGEHADTRISSNKTHVVVFPSMCK